jgi:hypothetical protein
MGKESKESKGVHQKAETTHLGSEPRGNDTAVGSKGWQDPYSRLDDSTMLLLAR